jgi:hypothetical protein
VRKSSVLWAAEQSAKPAIIKPFSLASFAAIGDICLDVRSPTAEVTAI